MRVGAQKVKSRFSKLDVNSDSEPHVVLWKIASYSEYIVVLQ